MNFINHGKKCSLQSMLGKYKKKMVADDDEVLFSIFFLLWLSFFSLVK